MATIVVQPKHLNAVLTELNQAQLLIVRWLAQQEKLQATWNHFTKELNGRIPEPSLLQVLNDLRMFGLVDYVAEPESGGSPRTRLLPAPNRSHTGST